MDIINIIASALCAILGAFGGASIFTIRQQRKLKDVEVIRNQAEEWIKLYNEADSERKALNEKINKLYTERVSLAEDVSKLRLQVQQLSWYRCRVERCSKRTPPHVYDANGVELEQPTTQS